MTSFVIAVMTVSYVFENEHLHKVQQSLILKDGTEQGNENLPPELNCNKLH